MLHNGEFNYSQQPFPLALPISYPSSTQVLPKYYPSTTQVLPKYMQAFWTWLHLGYTLGRPWVHLVYTLGRPWLRLGEDLGKTWRFLSQRIHLCQLVGIHVGDADVAGLGGRPRSCLQESPRLVECCPMVGSPKPMHPRQMRDTRRSEFPSFT